MHWSFFTYLILEVLTLLAVITWPSRKGKWLLCSALAFGLAARLASLILSAIDRPSLPQDSWQWFRELPMVSYTLSIILLLVYAVVARGGDGCRPVTEPGSREFDVQQALEDSAAILRCREWTYVLDYIIMRLALLFVLAMGAILIGFLVGIDGGNERELDSLILVFVWVVILIASFLWLFKDAYFQGRSPGKALTRLRVVDVEDGLPINAAQSFLRNWILYVPFGPILELIVANARSDHRRLGDLMAHSIVVRAKSPQPTRTPIASPHTVTPVETNRVSNTVPRTLPTSQAIRFRCHGCSKACQVPPAKAGRRAICPCGRMVTVPTDNQIAEV